MAVDYTVINNTDIPYLRHVVGYLEPLGLEVSLAGSAMAGTGVYKDMDVLAFGTANQVLNAVSGLFGNNRRVRPFPLTAPDGTQFIVDGPDKDKRYLDMTIDHRLSIIPVGHTPIDLCIVIQRVE